VLLLALADVCWQDRQSFAWGRGCREFLSGPVATTFSHSTRKNTAGQQIAECALINLPKGERVARLSHVGAHKIDKTNGLESKETTERAEEAINNRPTRPDFAGEGVEMILVRSELIIY
jgi:hypothetical protein